MQSRRRAPAAERNREPILEVLQPLLRGLQPASGVVLEIGSGTGQHVTFFAPRLPSFVWQPSDPSEEACASTDGWRAHTGAGNVLPAALLDARASTWRRPPSASQRSEPLAAVVAINVIHISPWSVCEGLFRGAARELRADGVLFLYGPYLRGAASTPGNLAFDRQLRARDPAWGVRELDAVVSLAGEHGLRLAKLVEMPANNLSLVFQRA